MAAVWLAAVPLAIGMSLMYPSLFTAVMDAAPESERTHAVGTFSVFFDMSTALGATLVGLVVSLSGERGGFAVAGAMAAGGLAVQWALRDRIGRRRLQPVDDEGTGAAA
jgi:MFS family permease